MRANNALGGFFRFLVSGALILTAVTTIQRTDAASSTNDSSSCGSETSACVDDDICASCFTDNDPTEYEECLTSVGSGGISSDSSGQCYGLALVVCCQDHVSENACLDNDAYVEYYECLWQSVQIECTLSGLSCSDDGSPVGVSSSKAASSRKPPHVSFACVLGLAAVLLGLTGI